MRKTEREIKSRAEIDAVIRQSRVCRLGMIDGPDPYIVPLCFGYDGQTLCFHCAREGRKLEILRRNPRVCFEFDILEKMIEAPAACDWGLRYRSVMGTGLATVVEELAEKRKALALIMAQYAGDRSFTFPEEVAKRTAVFQVKIATISGKQSKRE